MQRFKKWVLYIISLFGAVGTGLQNYLAVAALMQAIAQGAFAATRVGLLVIHSLAIALGGLCSTFANFCMNISLLKDFFKRFTKEEWKKRPKLKGWKRFKFWFGSSIFIITGILFGLTAAAFGPAGILAILSIVGGVFVAVIMIIQELETWFKSFDPKQDAVASGVSTTPSSRGLSAGPTPNAPFTVGPADKPRDD